MSKTSNEITPYWASSCGRATVYVGDCREVLPNIPLNQFHAVVTDPPYELNFMGRTWDSSGVAYDCKTWWSVMHVAKPGAHLLSFGGSRTYHRMACAIEDTDWEIRDTIMWIYGGGFPKGLDVSAAIDKELGFDREITDIAKRSSVRRGVLHSTHAGAGGYGFNEIWGVTAPVTEAAKQWEGWNTSLKPALEPIVLARKPIPTTVIKCVLEHGTGAINVDACRVGTTRTPITHHVLSKTSSGSGVYDFNKGSAGNQTMNGDFLKEKMDGRHPANLIHDGSDEVVNLMPDGAARYFYTAKADSSDRPHGRDSNTHPTVKPLDLMRYLVRLVCVQGGSVLDPFMGSGSTGCAAILEGMRFVGIEQSQEYADLAIGRLRLALEGRGADTTLNAPTPTQRRDGGAPLLKKIRGT